MGITRNMVRLMGAMFAIGSFFLVAAGVSFLWLNSSINAPLPLDKNTNIIVDKGESLGGIAGELKSHDIISDALIFKLAAYIMGAEKKLQAGEYQVTAGMSVSDIVEMMRDGKTVNYQITIPEGYTVQQVITLLNDNERLEGELDGAPAEGSLLPNTYMFMTGDKRSDVVAQMQAAMNQLKNELWDGRDRSIPLKSWDEAIILASIVEKETGIMGEMPRIAGVFVNRLNAGMPLQSDPTVVYAITNGLGHMQGKRLLLKHLEVDSPYNTYLNRGLPVGPIANPGRMAIEAVLHPEKNDYFYFVADGTGGHVFAKTLVEHNRNVVDWRKIRKEKARQAKQEATGTAEP